MEFDPFYHSLSEREQDIFNKYIQFLDNTGIGIEKKYDTYYSHERYHIHDFIVSKKSPAWLVSLNRDILNMLGSMGKIELRTVYSQYRFHIEMDYMGDFDDTMPRLSSLTHIQDIESPHLTWLKALDNDISALLEKCEEDEQHFAFKYLYHLGDTSLSFDEVLHALRNKPSRHAFSAFTDYTYWLSRSQINYILDKNTHQYLKICDSYVNMRKSGKDHAYSSNLLIKNLDVHPDHAEQISEELVSLPLNNI